MSSTDIDPKAIIDAEHLRLLAIFHFISAAFAFAGVLFATLYFVLVAAVFANPEIWAQSQEAPPPQAVITIFQWLTGIGVVWFVVACVGNLLSGLFLRTRRHRTFSMIIAGINCLHIPLGTLLGVFTLAVLGRESVRKLYLAASGAFTHERSSP
jgi:hypothetical protein